MLIVDIIFYILIGLSSATGYARGLAKECLRLCAWLGAFYISFLLAPIGSPYLTWAIASDTLRLVVVFFILMVLVLWFFENKIQPIVDGFVRKNDLSFMNCFLGAVFGLIRALLMASVVVILVNMTPAHHELWWRESSAVQAVENLQRKAFDWVPMDVQRRWELYLHQRIDAAKHALVGYSTRREA